MRLLLVLVVLLVAAADAAPALAAADRVTGGMSVPITGGATAAAPVDSASPPRSPSRQPAAASAPRAHVAQEGGAEAPPPEPDVDVRVPVREGDDAAPASPAPAARLGGLPQTGFAAIVLAALGAMSAAAGLALRRLARP